MVRLIAFALVLVAVGYAYEEYSGKSYGIKSTFRSMSGFALGGYGMATGATTSVGGSMKGMATGISSSLGN